MDTTADYAVFITYFVIVSAYGYTIYHKRKKNEHDAKAISWQKEHLHGGR